MVEAPVRKVRLLEDRAFVTRVFEGELSPDVTRLRILDLAPAVSDKSVNLKTEDPHLQVHACRVVRRRRNTSEMSSEKAEELQGMVREQEQKTTALWAEAAIVESSLVTAQSLLRKWIQETAADVNWGQTKEDNWNLDFTSLQDHQLALAAQSTKLKFEAKKEGERLTKLRQQLEEFTTVSDVVEAGFEIDVAVTQKAQVQIEIEYCVPSACWRPCHQAVWLGEEVRLESQACVWQNTGEDWIDAQLSFSTQRLSGGSQAPPLTRDILQLKKRQKQVVLETREESITSLAEFKDQMPGLDYNGEVLTLDGPELCTVRSDGKPHRFHLFNFETPLKAERMVAGEVCPTLFLSSRQKNTSGQPLLPGPVDLIKEGGVTGRSYLEHAAPQEEFEIHWGPQSEVRVSRHHKTGKQSKSVTSSWLSVDHTIDLHLSNLTDTSQSFKLRERIPVSEIKDVQVKQNVKKTTKQAEADKNGFVNWTVTLQAYECRSFQLPYEVKKKKSVEGAI